MSTSSAFTLAVGVQFDSMKDLRLACKTHAVYENFEIKTDYADKKRYRIHCISSERCPWRLHASLITTDEAGGSNIVEIKTLTSEHTCNGVRTSRHNQAGASMVSAAIQGRVRDQPSYRPVEVVRDVLREQGVKVSYSTAWRAKEEALAIINGSHEEAYARLPQYCTDLVQANPGSTIQLEYTTTNNFRRLFICYAASAKGFGDCRPVLGVDGAHLKGKYLGILLSATAVDANGSLFPLAHAVVDAENDDNWIWFINLLHKVIEEYAPAYLAPKFLTFVSDRQKGLLESVEQVFPGSPHGYCLRHLYENLHKNYKHPDLQRFLYQAARAKTEQEYKNKIDQMRGINSDAVNWLLAHATPNHWCEYYFPGRRYGHITSNIAESINAWLLEAREKPIIAMLEQIRHQLMEWFTARRQIDQNTEGILVSSVAKIIKNTLTTRARRYRIIESNDIVYEVFSPETISTCVVRLDTETCTCCEWQISGIPCAHVLAVSLGREDDPQIYAKAFYRLDAYRGIYSDSIFPPNVNAANTITTVAATTSISTVQPDITVLPPNTRRPPGRPKKQRIRGLREGGGRAKRNFRCSRCGNTGHSRQSCREAI
jgi:hypothetical protein